MINLKSVKKLRDESGAAVSDIRSALEEADDDLAKAKKILAQKGLEKAASKKDRQLKAGWIEVYSHSGKVGVLVKLLCETDFVAKTKEFQNLAHELALQVASMNPESIEELLSQEYIRDPSTTVDELIKGASGKLAENIQIERFERFALNE